MKVMVIGYSGSGKTTLAKKIERKYGIVRLSLDELYWKDGLERFDVNQIQIVKDFLEQNDEWVIDGNYSKLLYERRLDEADKVILMCFNRISCLYRVFLRYLYNRKRMKAMGKKPPAIEWKFVNHVLYSGRKNRYQLIQIKERYYDKIIYISNQRQLNVFENKNFIND